MGIGPRGKLYRRIPGRYHMGGFPASARPVNQGITYTAKAEGTGGNSITITIVAGGPANRALSVSVSGNAITVTPATDAGGVITTTKAGVTTAVNGNAPASALVTASGGDATAVAALAATNLSGGSAYVVGGR